MRIPAAAIKAMYDSLPDPNSLDMENERRFTLHYETPAVMERKSMPENALVGHFEVVAKRELTARGYEWVFYI